MYVICNSYHALSHIQKKKKMCATSPDVHTPSHKILQWELNLGYAAACLTLTGGFPLCMLVCIILAFHHQVWNLPEFNDWVRAPHR